jgi:hypothetical protein
MVNPQAKKAMYVKVEDQNNGDPLFFISFTLNLYLKGPLLIRHSMWRLKSLTGAVRLK